MTDEADRHSSAPHPRSATALYGQEAAERAYLDAAATGRLHHAWLVTGPRGVGKATLAWRIARHLIAGGRAATLDMASGEAVFRQVEALSSPQLFLARRPWDDKAERLKTAITVDEVRALKGFFQLAAADGGRRVAIVDSADDLNGAAANALLKILEEPPAGATLLLVSHRPAGLLPTIRSRCRELRCAPLGPEPLARALAAAGSEAPADGRLALLADGSVAAALDLVDGGGIALYEEIVGLLRRLPIDRRRLGDLADAAAGRAAAARYAMTLDLALRALGRLALAAAGTAPLPFSPAEAELFAAVATTPAQARLWAALLPRLAARAAHARAVNLDPAQVILDTFLQIDAAAAEARARAA